MTNLGYKNGQLMLEEVSLEQTAAAFGTPTYVYSRTTLEQNYQAYRDAFDQHGKNDHLVCYAVKANSNLGVLNVLAQLGSGFDIVSVGELERVILAGGDPSKVVFSGVAKREDEIRRALEAGVLCFNVESESELVRISRVASALGQRARVSIRVNPDVDAQTHPYISTGMRENKFGIDIDSALGIYQHALSLPAIEITGIDCHIGSQLTSLEPFGDALDRVLHLVDQLRVEGIELQHIDIGGGLGVNYESEQVPSINDYVARLLSGLGERKLSLIIEPGRSIAANAGILLTRVDTIKHNSEKRFAIVDAAMNDLIRPALYSAWQDIIRVQESSEAEACQYDIVGPVCETADFLAKDRQLAVDEGDLLAICMAGAYGFVMASNYNSRPRAAEVLVDGDRMIEIRKRESIEDLVRGESLATSDSI